MPHPILTIGIPTHNRPELLKASVEAIIADAGNRNVEIIVSDNASDKPAAEILGDLLINPRLHVYRNEVNIGVNKNIGRIVNEYASGEFVWILGDDDLIIEGAVHSILKVIYDNPSITYILANHTYLDIEERKGLFPLRSSSLPTLGYALFNGAENRLLKKWEDSLLLSSVAAAHTSIVCHIARRTLWMRGDYSGTVEHTFPTWEMTFPHLATLVPHLVGQEVFFHAKPLSILFVGAQEWFNDNWGRIMATHVLDFSDVLQVHGVATREARFYRGHVFSQGRDSLISYLSSLTDAQNRGRLQKSYLKRYWREPAALYFLFSYKFPLAHRALSLSKRLLKRVRGRIKRIFSKSWFS
jgi:glycosyltransferase involved in cell wall biosynthesis